MITEDQEELCYNCPLKSETVCPECRKMQGITEDRDDIMTAIKGYNVIDLV